MPLAENSGKNVETSRNSEFIVNIFYLWSVHVENLENLSMWVLPSAIGQRGCILKIFSKYISFELLSFESTANQLASINLLTLAQPRNKNQFELFECSRALQWMFFSIGFANRFVIILFFCFKCIEFGYNSIKFI